MKRFFLILLLIVFLSSTPIRADESTTEPISLCRRVLGTSLPDRAIDLLLRPATSSSPFLNSSGRPVSVDERRLATVAQRLTEAIRLAENHLDYAEAAKDPELRVEAQAEMAEIERQIRGLAAPMRRELTDYLEKDANKKRYILEVRVDAGGGGGADAQTWVQRLAGLYARQANGKTTKDFSIKELGGEYTADGAKLITFEVSGTDAYRFFKTEVGRHRFEFTNRGLTYTNNVSVSLIPAPEAKDMTIPEKEIRVETTTSQGPGGQNVNKVESAVRMTHLPTGITVMMQESRSQHINYEKALLVLTARVLEKKAADSKDAERNLKREQVGIGGLRNLPRVRTYDFKDRRLTDHRTGKQISLTADKTMVDIDLAPFAEGLEIRYLEELLK